MLSSCVQSHPAYHTLDSLLYSVIRCLREMKEFSDGKQNATDSTALAQQFNDVCSTTRQAALCNKVGYAIQVSRQGSMAKRPAMLCRELGDCKAPFIDESTCLVNVSSSPGLVPVQQLSLCSPTGLQGSQVPGVSDNRTLPAGRCTSKSECSGLDTCSMASSQKLCTCQDGVDTCFDHGECLSSNCGRCSDCITHVQPFVMRSNYTAAAVVADWTTFCQGTLRKLPHYSQEDLCRNVATSLASNHNASRRAGALCSLIGGITDGKCNDTSKCVYVLQDPANNVGPS